MAAYFATEQVAHEPSPGGTLAIWALERSLIEMFSITDQSPPLTIATAPQATNPNLAAQAGLFTLVRSAHDGVGHDEVVREWVNGFQRREATAEAMFRAQAPVLYKITAPQGEARALLRLLANEGVSAATIYPGYAGVAKSLVERRLWQR